MRMMEKTVRENQHWCDSCEDWYDGLVEPKIYVSVSYDGPVDDFDLDDYSTYTDTKCGGGCELEDDDYVNFTPGDVVYVCGSCNTTWPYESTAIECCS